MPKETFTLHEVSLFLTFIRSECLVSDDEGFYYNGEIVPHDFIIEEFIKTLPDQ